MGSTGQDVLKRRLHSEYRAFCYPWHLTQGGIRHTSRLKKVVPAESKRRSTLCRCPIPMLCLSLALSFVQYIFVAYASQSCVVSKDVAWVDIHRGLETVIRAGCLCRTSTQRFALSILASFRAAVQHLASGCSTHLSNRCSRARGRGSLVR